MSFRQKRDTEWKKKKKRQYLLDFTWNDLTANLSYKRTFISELLDQWPKCYSLLQYVTYQRTVHIQRWGQSWNKYGESKGVKEGHVIEFWPSISDQNDLEEHQGNMVWLTKCKRDGVKRDTFDCNILSFIYRLVCYSLKISYISFAYLKCRTKTDLNRQTDR